MSTRINQNVLSLTAQRNIWAAQNDMDRAVTRLSSGLRVNYAWDDPAALNMSERFRAQIGSMVEAEKNAGYAINVLRMADGALSVVDEKLIRMRALAIQSSNGTLAAEDRQALHLEFDSLRSEITRIARSTNFNGKYLLDGSWSAENPSGIKFHVGTMNIPNVDYYFVQMGNITADSLGIGDLDLTTTASAQTAITELDMAIAAKDTLRTRLGSYVNRLQNTILNQQIARESTVASEEMIRDADIAAEMSEFVRAQILMQSGISMLSQANMVPQMVAQLIG